MEYHFPFFIRKESNLVYPEVKYYQTASENLSWLRLFDLSLEENKVIGNVLGPVFCVQQMVTPWRTVPGRNIMVNRSKFECPSAFIHKAWDRLTFESIAYKLTLHKFHHSLVNQKPS